MIPGILASAKFIQISDIVVQSKSIFSMKVCNECVQTIPSGFNHNIVA